jgi:membrane protein
MMTQAVPGSDPKLASRAAAGAKGHRARQFWEIPKAGWRDIAIRTWNETGEDNISLLAAGVAFYSFLAFVPLLASIVLVYGIAVAPADVARHMQTLVQVLPSDAARIVGDQLKSLTETPATRTTIGLIVAILLAIYGAMRGATSVIGALNITYGERETRSFVRTTGLSAAFTIGAVLVAIVAMIAISAMSLIGTWIHLPPVAGPLITGALWIGTALVASALVAVIYRYGPDREDAKWTWLTPGAVFASVGALLATFLFGLYVSHFGGYNATYGALGAVVSFLMWLYVTAFVVLLGAELNAEIERQTAEDTTTGPEQAMGDRGAKMADTAAAGTDADDNAGAMTVKATKPAASPSSQDRSSGSPVVAGFVAARASRMLGEVPVGTLSMTLLSTGISMLGRRGKAKGGLLCLGAGALLILRAERAAAADDRRNDNKAGVRT